jgi:hypothetical protein
MQWSGIDVALEGQAEPLGLAEHRRYGFEHSHVLVIGKSSRNCSVTSGTKGGASRSLSWKSRKKQSISPGVQRLARRSGAGAAQAAVIGSLSCGRMAMM